MTAAMPRIFFMVLSIRLAEWAADAPEMTTSQAEWAEVPMAPRSDVHGEVHWAGV